MAQFECIGSFPHPTSYPTVGITQTFDEASFKSSILFQIRNLSSTSQNLIGQLRTSSNSSLTLNDAKVSSPNAFTLSNRLGVEESSAKGQMDIWSAIESQKPSPTITWNPKHRSYAKTYTLRKCTLTWRFKKKTDPATPNT